ncbi:FAD-dependent oxidoreductase [Psychroflexus montanilacus]|uniref:FAD-dependent oxidoreductase n=1 Tax=Psychroflexus montanilacus TaxID=2873598 RepID=UPI001CC9F9D2|nr:NAD(P)/FAD-dependent oxidoreductase [Psychroflexus montanilacus]MBZ9651742.1 FAD-dependent monooxygenase [Psychroflexus montanilacus]
MATKEHILIIGAGLCGSLLALRMAQLSYKVTLTEKRSDLRKAKLAAGRSINLALSNRGLKGLKMVGLEKEVESLCIPMYGRMLHSLQGETQLSKYSGREGEYINSISRTGLNALLLDKLETYPNVEIQFENTCTNVNLKQANARFKPANSNSEYTLQADYIIGTDGAGSVVRQQMEREKGFLFSRSQDFLTHGYKELTFPATKDGHYATEKGALHIWPRGENMLIALPNQDKSFTVTLFLAYEGGKYNFNNLTTEAIVEEYFKEVYPDAYELMPDLKTEFFENPTAPLGTIRCFPWTYGKTLLMGDASHAIVPFYGQGMNASFEDVVEFDKALAESDFDLDASFKHFSQHRKPDADAIADLALDNFHEMKSHTADEVFLEKRKLELEFEKEFPNEYHSKYSLVTFRADLPYTKAISQGRAQDLVIQEMLRKNILKAEMSLQEKLNLVREISTKAEDNELIFDI